MSIWAEERDELTDEVERLKALSVEHVLIGIVPGNGDGFEIYPKSVKELEDHLAKQYEKIDDLESEIVRLNNLLNRFEAIDAATIQLKQSLRKPPT